MKIRLSVPKGLFALLIISLSVMIYTSSFFNVLYDRTFFSEFYEEHGVEEEVEHPTQKSAEIVAYLNGEITTLDDENPVFADKGLDDAEIRHLEDVKEFIMGLKAAYLISFTLFVLLTSSFIIALFLRKDKEAWRKARIFFMKLQVYVIAVCSVSLLLIWLLTSFGFDWLFRSFHELAFQEGTWTFAPGTLSLILFPSSIYGAFMSEILFNVLVFVLMLSMLFMFIYIIYRPRHSKNLEHPGN
ncbi:MAG: DUF1461 domain-containing protein [Candidatus Woesearchaeota archaeon]